MSYHSFSVANGRKIYENGVTKIWQCATCMWWRQWEEERCRGCGALRDMAPRSTAAKPLAERFSENTAGAAPQRQIAMHSTS